MRHQNTYFSGRTEEASPESIEDTLLSCSRKLYKTLYIFLEHNKEVSSIDSAEVSSVGPLKCQLLYGSYALSCFE